jgi:hypothetical protein
MKVPKPLDLPAAVAYAFVEDALAYFDKKDRTKRDVIAARQLQALKGHQGTREKTLRLSDVKKMFTEMRKHLRR